MQSLGNYFNCSGRTAILTYNFMNTDHICSDFKAGPLTVAALIMIGSHLLMKP